MTKVKIDITKQYTSNGNPVVGLQIIPLNSSGGVVSYPVKGSILRKGKEPEYCIWSLYGEYDIVYATNANRDLKLKEEV